jgi:phosphonate transport system permease protein
VSRSGFRTWSLTALVLAVYWWAWSGLELDPIDVVAGVPHLIDFAVRMIPPDTSVALRAAGAMVETVQMSVLGTSLGAALALPLAFAAARNLAPGWSVALARTILNLTRTIPPILWAVVLVAAVGLGPLAGVLALTFYSTGMLGKLYYESLERIEGSTVEAVAATGAAPLLVYRHAVLPQFLAAFTSHTFYGFEYNVRHASVLGLVGAGGIGFELLLYVRAFQYDKLAMTLLVLFAAVVLVDWLGGVARRRIS